MSYTGTIDPRYYEMKLLEAGKFFGPDHSGFVSIKLRPIIPHPADRFEGLYVDSETYKELHSELRQHVRIGPEGSISRGKAWLCGVQSMEFLFVEHETGPEIIFALKVAGEFFGATAAGLTALNQLIQLINNLSKLMARKSKGPQTAISIEKRLSDTGKIIRRLNVASDQAGLAIEKVEELLG